jgi:hypothetical protein
VADRETFLENSKLFTSPLKGIPNKNLNRLIIFFSQLLGRHPLNYFLTIFFPFKKDAETIAKMLQILSSRDSFLFLGSRDIR